jgi:hypothetical protein
VSNKKIFVTSQADPSHGIFVKYFKNVPDISRVRHVYNYSVIDRGQFQFGILHNMGTYIEQAVLAKEVEAAKAKVIIGTEYRHYKGQDKLYKVLGFGFLEANDELCVIYQALYGEGVTFLRPLTNWLEQVEWEGKMVPRFAKV